MVLHVVASIAVAMHATAEEEHLYFLLKFEQEYDLRPASSHLTEHLLFQKLSFSRLFIQFYKYAERG